MTAQVVLFGNVGKIEEKSNILTISVAVSAGSKDVDKKFKTDWYKCTVYQGDVYEQVKKKALVPGTRVIVTGTIVRNEYQPSEGSVRSNPDVNVSNLVKMPVPKESNSNSTQSTNSPYTSKSSTAPKTPAETNISVGDIPF